MVEKTFGRFAIEASIIPRSCLSGFVMAPAGKVAPGFLLPEHGHEGRPLSSSFPGWFRVQQLPQRGGGWARRIKHGAELSKRFVVELNGGLVGQHVLGLAAHGLKDECRAALVQRMSRPINQGALPAGAKVDRLISNCRSL